MRRNKETIGNQEWPDRQGEARVLVENSDGAQEWALQGILGAAGYDVAVCPGPSRARRVRCPLVEDGQCALAEGADVVLNSLSLSQQTSRDVIRSLRAQLPETPVVVEVTTSGAQLHADTLDGCLVERLPMTRERVPDAISEALSSTRR